MSKYYNINGLKVRVSDHEPNTALNGGNDIELYVRSADNQLISVVAQLERVCEKRGLDIEDFAEIANEWADGSYDKNVFCAVAEQQAEGASISQQLSDIIRKQQVTVAEKLSGYKVTRFTPYAEIKAIAEATGVGAMAIKRHFGLK